MHEGELPERDLVGRNRGPQPRERAEQGRKRDPQLEPAELGTEAAVQPVAEGEVRDGSTVRIDAVGSAPNAASRLAPDSEHSTMSPTSIATSPTDVGEVAKRGNATWTTERCRSSSSTNRSDRDPAGAQAVGQRRLLEKRERAQGEHGRGGLVAPGQQPIGELGQLPVRQVVPVAGDQVREQARPGMSRYRATSSPR